MITTNLRYFNDRPMEYISEEMRLLVLYRYKIEGFWLIIRLNTSNQNTGYIIVLPLIQ